MRINLMDQVPLQSRKETAEGFLLAQAAVTKANTVSRYTRGELGLDGDATDTVGVLRTEDTVFAEETQDTLRLRPVTQGHPPDGVAPDNARMTMVGATGETPVRDEDSLVISVAIHDQDAINEVQGGKDQVSLGYRWDLRQESGEHDGVAYDYVSDSPMIINHLALVPQGRLGPEVRVRDSANGEVEDSVDNADSVDANDTDTDDASGDDGRETNDAYVSAEVFLNLFDSFYYDGEEMSEDIISRVTEMIQTALGGSEGSVGDQAPALAETICGDLDRVVNDRASKRADLLLAARGLMDEESFEAVKDKDEKAILVAAVGDKVANADGKSIEYLRAALDFLPSTNDAAPVPNPDGRQRAEDQRQNAPANPAPTVDFTLDKAYNDYDAYLRSAYTGAHNRGGN